MQGQQEAAAALPSTAARNAEASHLDCRLPQLRRGPDLLRQCTKNVNRLTGVLAPLHAASGAGQPPTQ